MLNEPFRSFQIKNQGVIIVESFELTQVIIHVFTYYITQLSKLEAQWAETVSLTFHSALRKLNTEPPIGASHQVLVIWVNSYKEEDNQKSTNQKQEWSVVAMFIDGQELNEQSLQMTFQVSIHLAKHFQRRFFLEINQSELNQQSL